MCASFTFISFTSCTQFLIVICHITHRKGQHVNANAFINSNHSPRTPKIKVMTYAFYNILFATKTFSQK